MEKQTQTQGAERMVKEWLANIMLTKTPYGISKESDITFDVNQAATYIAEAIFYRNRFKDKDDRIILSIDDVYEILASLNGVTFVKKHDRDYIIAHANVLHDVEYFVDENTYELAEKYHYESEDVDEEIERRARLAAAKAAGYMKLLCETMWQFDSSAVEEGEAEAKRGSLYKPLMNIADLSDMICDIANILDIAASGWSHAVGEKYDVDEYYKLAVEKIVKKLLSEESTATTAKTQ